MTNAQSVSYLRVRLVEFYSDMESKPIKKKQNTDQPDKREEPAHTVIAIRYIARSDKR